jgi:hypothetical protein
MKNVLKKACCALLALLFVFGMIASAGPAYAEGPSEPAAPAEAAPETVTVKFDLGVGHEAWAQSELLREKLESYGRGLTVVGVEGSVMSIEAPPSYPEPDGTRIKNSVNGLSSAFDIVLSRTITGEDGKYDFPDAFDAGEWLYSVGLKPMEAYGSYADYRAETEENDKVMPVEGQTFYALWAKPVEEASITVEAPVCGTEITVEYIQSENPDVGYPLTVQEPHPNAVVSAQNAALDVEEGIPACLWKQEDAENPDIPFFWEAYSGPVTGGETYLAEVDLRADFGYYFPEDVKINVTGGTLDSDLSYTLQTFYTTFISVPAVHDWGDWTVTKEATLTEEGVETRTCKADPSHTETRAIPKLEPPITYRSTKGDGAVWTKGSSATADFTFNRSVDDGETLAHFTGIQVDGKAIDASNYDAVSGGVTVKLKPAYLSTLSVGQHTLTAQFDDGESVTVKFTVQQSSSVKPNTNPSGSGTQSHTPKTGDDSNVPLWSGILSASLIVFLSAAVCLGRERKKQGGR